MIKLIYTIFIFFFVFANLYASSVNIGIIYNGESKSEKILISHITEKFTEYGYKFELVSSGLDESEILENLKDNTHVLALGISSANVAQASNLPGVFFLVPTPQKLGLVDKNGNYKSLLQGICMDICPSELFSFVEKFMSKHKRIGVVYNPENSSAFMEKARKAKDAFGIELIEATVDNYHEVMPAFYSIRNKVDVMVFLNDPSVLHPFNKKNLIKLSLASKIPAIGPTVKMAKDGCLVGLSYHHDDLTGRVAKLMKIVIENKQLPTMINHVDRISVSYNIKTSVIIDVELSDEAIEDSDNLF